MRTFLLATVGTLALCGASIGQERPPVVPQQPKLINSSNLWKDPIFRKRLLGSFGINSNIEPNIPAAEQEIYAEASALIADKPDEARQMLLKFLQDNPDASAIFDFTLGNIYFAQDNKRRAVLLFKAALKKFPNFRRAHQNLATIYVQAGAYDAAIEHFSQAIRLGASDGNLYGLLGSALSLTGQFTAAETAFRNAVLMQPAVKEWKLGLSQSLLMQGQYANAAAIIGKMIEADPANKDLWLLQASAFIGSKEMLKAAGNYELVDMIAGLEAKDLKTLGDIYVNEEMLSLAAEAYLRSFEKSPADIESALQAGEALVQRDGLVQAKSLVSRVETSAGATASKEHRAQMMRLQAKIAFAEARSAEAAEILNTLLTIAPLDGEAILMLGDHHRDQDEPDRADLVYQRAESIKGFEADAKIRRAQIAVSKEDFKSAISLFKQSQEIDRRESVAKYLEELERFVKRRGA